MSLIGMYMVPAILLVVFTFIIVFTGSRLHISDTNKVVFMVFAEVIINVLQISIIRLFIK